jgi:hypothetical protein
MVASGALVIMKCLERGSPIFVGSGGRMGELLNPVHLIIFLIMLVVTLVVCRVLWRLGSKLK